MFSFFLSSRRRHTRCSLVTGVQTCALPIFRSTHLRDGDGEEQYRQRAKHDAHRHGAAPLTLAVKREFLGRHDSSILSAINAPKRMNRYSTEKANICLSAAIFAGSVSRLIATRAASSRNAPVRATAVAP